MQQVIISSLNGKRFVPENIIKIEPYNHLRYEDEWYHSNLQGWQKADAKCYQIVQKNDYLSLQLMANKGSTVTVSLYNCVGRLFKTDNFDIVPFSSDTEINDELMSYYQFESYNYFENAAYKDNIYYLRITVSFDNGKSQSFLSEPIDLREKHHDSILIEYQNSYNKNNVLFEQTSQKFCFRVKGVGTASPQTDKVIFKDQYNDSVLLSGDSYILWEFVIGGKGFYLPDYAISILNDVLSLDSLKIDNKRYTPTEETSIEKQDNDRTYTSASFVLAEYRNKDTEEFYSNEISLFTIANDFSTNFAVYEIKLLNSDFVEFHFPFARQILGLMINNYLAELNKAAPQKGLKGQFTKIAKGTYYDIVYQIANGERINGKDVVILDKRFNTLAERLLTDLVPTKASIKYTFGGLGVKVAFFSDNAYLSIKQGSSAYKDTETSFLVDTPTIKFPSYIEKVTTWYSSKQDIDVLRITDEPRVSTPIMALEPAPDTLKEFEFSGSDIDNTFDFYQVLNPSMSVIEKIILNNNTKSTQFGYFIDPYNPKQSFLKLKYIDLRGYVNLDLSGNPNAADMVVRKLYSAYVTYWDKGTPPKYGYIKIGNGITSPYTSGSQFARDYFTDVLKWEIS